MTGVQAEETDGKPWSYVNFGIWYFFSVFSICQMRPSRFSVHGVPPAPCLRFVSSSFQLGVASHASHSTSRDTADEVASS